MLTGHPRRLVNQDQGGGYRDERPSNLRITNGPEFFDGDPPGKGYLPAYQRYSGRFFTALRRRSPKFWKQVPEYPVEIVFVSALYGLVLWDEPIQEYDCHFADQFHDTGQALDSFWRTTLQASLIDFLQSAKRSPDGKFEVVYDLLSDFLYQQVIDWR